MSFIGISQDLYLLRQSMHSKLIVALITWQDA